MSFKKNYLRIPVLDQSALNSRTI